MTALELDRLIKALEALGQTGDFSLDNYITLAKDRAIVLWAKEHRSTEAWRQAAERYNAAQNADDVRMLFGELPYIRAAIEEDKS
jgi:hypothetical protein